MLGDFASSHASATCPGVTCLRPAISMTRSTIGWLASRASGVKRGNRLRMSLAGERLAATDGAGEEALPQRGPRHEPDAELLAHGKDLGLGVTGPDRVLALHRGDGLDGMGAADRVRAGLRQSEVADLAGDDEVLDGTGDVLDRHVGVDAVLVEQVDVVGPQPPQ